MYSSLTEYKRYKTVPIEANGGMLTLNRTQQMKRHVE